MKQENQLNIIGRGRRRLKITAISSEKYWAALRYHGRQLFARDKRSPVIDIIRTSASRPELLKASTESMLKNLKFSGRMRWILHEDFLNPKASEEAVAYAKKSGIFDIILTSRPPIGQGLSLGRLMMNVRAPYILCWEDDWELLREIRLEDCLKIMEENPDVHQIAFNKRDTMKDVSGFKKLEIERSGFKLVTSPHWRITPALWRTSFIRPRWIFHDNRHFNWILNDHLKQGMKELTPEWIVQNLGTYYFGKFDEKQFVRHLGENQSLRLEQYQWHS